MYHADTSSRRLRLRHGLVVLGCTLTGVGLLAGNAIADQVNATTSGPSIKLTMVDTDIVAVSGRNFPASTDIVVDAKSTTHTGTGTVKSSAQGRILLAFSLPSDLNGKLTITAGTQGTKATIDIDSTGSSTTTSSTSTTAPSASSTTTSTTTKPATTTPSLNQKLAELPEAETFNDKVAKYNELRDKANAKAKEINTRLLASGNATTKEVADAIKGLNDATIALNDAANATNDVVTALNTKATAATTDAEIAALKPQLTELSSAMDQQIAMIEQLITMEDKVLAKLPATS